MIQGTTPTHIFNIPFDTSLVKEVKIIYAQDDSIIFTKTIDDCVLEDKTIRTTLTQKDTFLFTTGKEVQIQLRVLTKKDVALASVIKKVSCCKCLDNEVLQ